MVSNCFININLNKFHQKPLNEKKTFKMCTKNIKIIDHIIIKLRSVKIIIIQVPTYTLFKINFFTLYF